MLCGQLGDDNKLMFCDKCDKGFHTDCLTPQLLEVPEGIQLNYLVISNLTLRKEKVQTNLVSLWS